MNSMAPQIGTTERLAVWSGRRPTVAASKINARRALVRIESPTNPRGADQPAGPASVDRRLAATLATECHGPAGADRG
jgi:hypothetical protein